MPLSVLVLGGQAKQYMNKLVLTTGMGTNHLTLQRGVHHPQNFNTGTIALALPEEKEKQNISICSFYSSVLPFLAVGTVFAIVTHWDELKCEEVEAIHRQRVKQGNALGKTKKTAWELYNDMTDGVMPPGMTEEMIKSIVGNAAWKRHKTGPNGVNRSVQITAIEAAYRDMVERKMNKPAWKLYNRMTDGELPPNICL